MRSEKVTEIGQHESATAALEALIDEMRIWLDAAYERHIDVPWSGGHDEGTFVTSWADYYRLTGDERVIQLARVLRDSAVEWGREHFTHGYHPKQEAHHGPEHFVIFLAWLNEVDPDDSVTAEAIIDAAHHVGNWIEEIPAWFDWDARRFVSPYLGTEHVGDDGTNIVEHLRFVRLAVIAYSITQEQRYLDFACLYGWEWAGLILDGEIPVYLGSDREGYEQARQRFLGAAPKGLESIARHEIHVASGTPELFLRLWEVTGDTRFADAAKTLVTPLLRELGDPYGHPTGVLFSLCRHRLNEESLDQQIVQTVGPPPEMAGLKLGVRSDEHWGELHGIGKRKDMPAWFVLDAHGGEQACQWPSPAALMLAHEVTGNEDYVRAAASLAAARLQLGQAVYDDDGRRHGCGSRSVAAVCRGHGRNWGAGNVSGVLGNPAVPELLGKSAR